MYYTVMAIMHFTRTASVQKEYKKNMINIRKKYNFNMIGI